MTDQVNQAAQVEPSYKIEGDDQAQNLEASGNQQVDSATTNQVDSNNEQATSEPAEDGFQKRINKVTADKYAEKRRADALQAKLDDLSKTPSNEQVKAPVLDDFDFDDDAFNKANIQYHVQQELSKQNDLRKQSDSDDKMRQASDDFNQKVSKFGKEDFFEKAGSIPDLPPGVADALMQSDMGPELIYHLADHLDQADALAGMTPAAAMMELGRMHSTMTATKNIEPSAAPDPIQPLSSGGAMSAERGPAGATFE